MDNIIITGCNGQLGRAINKVLENDNRYVLYNTDVDELDITNIDKVMEFAREVKPAAIINCAAFTNVNGCETNFDTAFKINAIGPRNLAIAANDAGAKMIQVSTDYVFSGKVNRPLREYDPVDPQSAYGVTKLEGEKLVKEFANRYFILRTAWLYGDGKNFVRTMMGAAQGRDEVTVVNDQFGNPTSALELAKAIAFLLPTDNYGTFHATCEGETNWADFTREFYRLGGVKTTVRSVSTQDYAKLVPGQANRPSYSMLDNYMLAQTSDYRFADWHEAIAEYMKDFQ